MGLRYKGETVIISDKEYDILFTVNVIDELEEYFNETIGSENLKKWLFKENGTTFSYHYKNVAYVIWRLVVENIEIRRFNGEECEDVTLVEVKRSINTANIGEYLLAITNAFLGSFKMSEEESPNVPSNRTLT